MLEIARTRIRRRARGRSANKQSSTRQQHLGGLRSKVTGAQHQLWKPRIEGKKGNLLLRRARRPNPDHLTHALTSYFPFSLKVTLQRPASLNLARQQVLRASSTASRAAHPAPRSVVLGPEPERVLTKPKAKQQKPAPPAMERTAVDSGLDREPEGSFASEEVALHQREFEFGSEFRTSHLNRLQRE